MGSYVDFQLFRFSGFPSPHPTPSGLPAVYQPKRRIRSRWLSIFHRISTQPCQQAGIFLCGPKGSEMEENEVKKIKQLFRKGVALALAAVTTLSVLRPSRYRLRPSGQRSRSPTVMTEMGIPSVISRLRLITESRSVMRERPGPGSMPTEIMPTVSSRESPCIPGTHWRRTLLWCGTT